MAWLEWGSRLAMQHHVYETCYQIPVSSIAQLIDPDLNDKWMEQKFR